MTDKAATPKPVKVKTVDEIYSLPELGIAVEASSVSDAVEKGKAHVKKSKEKKDV